jgi:hypothetical protein
MNITLIVFVLIILLFGFNSTRRVKTRKRIGIGDASEPLI